MKNYLRENIVRYRRVARTGGPADYADFSSRGFLDDVIPRLSLPRERARVLELGTGIGPGAIYLAERGFAVHAVDVIPDAIAQARRAAAARGLDVRFEVMDVTRIPHQGAACDLIVDSYCLQGIVLDADREAVFRAVEARLHPRGYYRVSSAMYAAARHRPDRQVVDARTGRVFDRYDETSLFDPATDIYYQRQDGTERIDGSIRVNGSCYSPVPPLPHRPPAARGSGVVRLQGAPPVRWPGPEPRRRAQGQRRTPSLRAARWHRRHRSGRGTDSPLSANLNRRHD